jgi:uncharacterized membrane protein
VIADSLFVVAVLSVNVALSEWLARRAVLRHLGSALLVIVITAAVANAGIIPTYDPQVPVYSHIFATLAPLAIFWLLLRVDLGSVLRAGMPMIVLFLVGTAGTVVGVLAGLWLVGGERAFGELHHALGGMFVGTYTGGSINFNAVALEYGVVHDGILYTGAAAVDSAATTVWMAATVALPRLLARFWPASRRSADVPVDGGEPVAAVASDTETLHPLDGALLLALGAAAVWVSNLVAARVAAASGVQFPSILVLTTLALVLAQLPAIQRLRGTRVIGWLAVMYFLAVIGALCDLTSVGQLGALGLRLILFVVVLILVHGAIVFGFAAVARYDADMAAVASQANIGGGTSALALARSLGRADLVLPAILVGSLGNALGTYLGFLVAAWLR